MSEWKPRIAPPCPKCGTPLSIQRGVGPYRARCFECCEINKGMKEGKYADYFGPLGIEYDLRNLEFYVEDKTTPLIDK